MDASGGKYANEKEDNRPEKSKKPRAITASDQAEAPEPKI
jgi:hypothetical protein